MSGRSSYISERGDVVWIGFDPQSGREQAGRRPAVILSPSSYNGRVGLAIVCSITSRVKGYPFEVPVPPGLGVTGVVLVDQIKSLDWRARRAEWVDRLDQETMFQVARRLAPLLPDPT